MMKVRFIRTNKLGMHSRKPAGTFTKEFKSTTELVNYVQKAKHVYLADINCLGKRDRQSFINKFISQNEKRSLVVI